MFKCKDGHEVKLIKGKKSFQYCSICDKGFSITEIENQEKNTVSNNITCKDEVVSIKSMDVNSEKVIDSNSISSLSLNSIKSTIFFDSIQSSHKSNSESDLSFHLIKSDNGSIDLDKDDLSLST